MKMNDHHVSITSWDSQGMSDLSVAQLHEQAVSLHRERMDFKQTPIKEHSMARDGKIVLQDEPLEVHNGRTLFSNLAAQYSLEDTALDQLGRKLGPYIWPGQPRKRLPVDYMKACHAHEEFDLWDDNINAWLGRFENGATVRTHGNSIRAWMGSNYKRVDSDDVLELMRDVLDEEPDLKYRLFKPHLSRDGCDIHVITGIDDRDDTGGGGATFTGFSVFTGEVGQRQFGLTPFMGHSWCTNTTRYDLEAAVTFRHVGDREARMTMLKMAMADAIGFGPELMSKLAKASRERVSLVKAAAKAQEQFNLSEDFIANVGVGSRGHETVAGFSSGLTFAIQKENVPIEQRAQVETFAGNILDGEWRSDNGKGSRPAWFVEMIERAERQFQGAEVR